MILKFLFELFSKNQKLKRLAIDDTNQSYRKSITFSDEHPVKVTAKVSLFINQRT